MLQDPAMAPNDHPPPDADSAAGSSGSLPGTVYLVGAGPGDADLITLRGHRLLQRADVVVHDDLVDARLYRDLDVDLYDVGKRAGRHKMQQAMINELLVELARQPQTIIRLKGGDPFVLGRGGEEVWHLQQNGVRCEVVPGVSSATAAPLLAGIPVTRRGVADSFCVVSCHPRDGEKPMTLPPWDAKRTVVVLMGVKTMPRWTGHLLELGYPPDLPVAFIARASTDRQHVTRTSLAAAASLVGSLRAPIVAVVGYVASEPVVETRDGPACRPDWKSLTER